MEPFLSRSYNILGRSSSCSFHSRNRKRRKLSTTSELYNLRSGVFDPTPEPRREAAVHNSPNWGDVLQNKADPYPDAPIKLIRPQSLSARNENSFGVRCNPLYSGKMKCRLHEPIDSLTCLIITTKSPDPLLHWLLYALLQTSNWSFAAILRMHGQIITQYVGYCFT